MHRRSLITVLENVLTRPHADIALHEPCISEIDKNYVMSCLESTFVSSVGAYVDRLENQLGDYLGVKKVVAVVNGTAALHVALSAIDIKEGDEVLTPALCFVGTANAISHASAVPHFVDSCPITMGISPVALKEYLSYVAEPALGGFRNRFTGRRLAALIPVHVFGHPCEMLELLEIAQKYKLSVVEDAAESLGSFYLGKHTGTFGKIGIFVSTVIKLSLLEAVEPFALMTKHLGLKLNI